MKKTLRIFICAAIAAGMALSASSPVYADKISEVKTSVTKDITELPGQYTHWDGVSPIAQFRYTDGSFCLAVDGDEYITIVKIGTDGSVVSDDIKLKKAHPIFGTVVCDANGYFYAITGEINETSDTSKQTVFISKYAKSGGVPMMTVGETGSSGLQSYHGSSYNTKIPFDSGVSAAINGNTLAVHYGREMYNGHQSNSVWAININLMSTIQGTAWISSHSFAHRAIPYGDGFLFASEGDSAERAFSTYAIETSSRSVLTYKKGYIFHFWVEKDAYNNGKWGVLNNNYAHLAGIVSLNNGTAALVGTAAPSLTSAAATEREQLFVQIFDPYADLTQESSYVTKGTRSGLSGSNGDQQVTNYGVKWLADYTDSTIENPQVVGTDDGKIVILFERGDRKAWAWGWEFNRYDGLYYMILDSAGNVIKPVTLFSKTARLNPCTMPVYTDGIIYWAGNTISDRQTVYINMIDLTKDEEVGIKGDADGNGIVDHFDAALVLAYAEGKDVTIDKKAADVNGDGAVDRADADLILRYASGNTDLF